jgi:hypothetical protein
MRPLCALVIGCCLAVAALADPAAEPLRAEVSPAEVTALADRLNLSSPSQPYYKLVRHFDFDEAEAGNFEPRPMHWGQLTGPGFPAYAEGAFDPAVGHTAPPSFRLATPLESVAFEYEYPDLDVIPGADYLVIGHVRTQNVRHGRAFVEAHFVDRFGVEIPESKRISALVRSTGAADEPWQRVEFTLSGHFPTAHSLRVGVYLLQGYLWRDPPAGAADPVIPEDVHAVAWFDDLSVYRLPRAILRLSEPGNVIPPGTAAALIVETHNSTDQELRATLTVTDPDGFIRHEDEFPIPAHTTTPLRAPLPPLPPDTYKARLALVGDDVVLRERTLRFAVLAELPERAGSAQELAIDLGGARLYEPESIRELVRHVGAGATRVGVPMAGTLDTVAAQEHYRDLETFCRELATRRIATTGVTLAGDALHNGHTARSTRLWLAEGTDWQDAWSPVLAQPFAALIDAWQLGDELLEAPQAPWTPDLIDAARRHLERFMSSPRLFVPTSVAAPNPPLGYGVCYWLPGEVSAQAMAQHLGMFGEHSVQPRWLTIGPPAPGLDYRTRLTDVARRVAIGKAVDPDRLIVPAPCQLARGSGAPAWEPTDEYTALRTLFHHLGGRRGVGAIALPFDGIALIFDGPRGSCMVVWTWRSEALTEPVGIYLGGAPTVVDLWGRRQAVEVVDGRAQVYLTPMPQLLVDVDGPLALLQASFTVTPTYVQIHDPNPSPVLMFTNHYGERLQAELEFETPGGWQVAPGKLTVDAAPGSRFEQPLALSIPLRQPASRQNLKVRMHVDHPTEATLEFDVPVTIGLRDVLVEITARWEDGRLLVEQTLRNLSRGPVSFGAFCQAPLRPQLEHAFIDVPAGESQTHVYVIADEQVRELAGMTLHLGLREVRGKRTLDQLVEVPP